MLRFSLLLTIALALLISSARSAEHTAEAMRLLKTNCFSCHNSEKKKGGLVMTSREALLKGGDNGAALDLNAPEKSMVLESLAADADPHMPPKKQLSAAQIATLSAWVKDGAKWDESALIAEASKPRDVKLGTLPASYRPALGLAVSPDATRLAVGCGNEVLLYDINGAETKLVSRASVHPDAVQALAWSPDGKQLVSGAFRRLVIWNTETLAPEKQLTDGLTDRIAAIRFLPDGKQFVVADGRVAENGAVRLIDTASGAIVKSWTAHADTIFDLAVSSDGKLLATAGGDKLVKIWDLATQQELAKLEGHTAQVFALAFNPDATQLVSGGADQQLKVWDVKTRERINTLGQHSAAITSRAWSSVGPTIVAATDVGVVARYTDLTSHSGAQSSDSAKERKLEDAATALHGVAVSANGERVFASTQDGRLLAWNKDGKLGAKIALNENPAPPQPSPSFIRDVLPVLSKAGSSVFFAYAPGRTPGFDAKLAPNGFVAALFPADPALQRQLAIGTLTKPALAAAVRAYNQGVRLKN